MDRQQYKYTSLRRRMDRLKINYCSYNELVCYVGVEPADTIIRLREVYGSVTQANLHRSMPHVDMACLFDFTSCDPHNWGSLCPPTPSTNVRSGVVHGTRASPYQYQPNLALPSNGSPQQPPGLLTSRVTPSPTHVPHSGVPDTVYSSGVTPSRTVRPSTPTFSLGFSPSTSWEGDHSNLDQEPSRPQPSPLVSPELHPARPTPCYQSPSLPRPASNQPQVDTQPVACSCQARIQELEARVARLEGRSEDDSSIKTHVDHLEARVDELSSSLNRLTCALSTLTASLEPPSTPSPPPPTQSTPNIDLEGNGRLDSEEARRVNLTGSPIPTRPPGLHLQVEHCPTCKGIDHGEGGCPFKTPDKLLPVVEPCPTCQGFDHVGGPCPSETLEDPLSSSEDPNFSGSESMAHLRPDQGVA